MRLIAPLGSLVLAVAPSAIVQLAVLLAVASFSLVSTTCDVMYETSEHTRQ